MLAMLLLKNGKKNVFEDCAVRIHVPQRFAGGLKFIPLGAANKKEGGGGEVVHDPGHPLSSMQSLYHRFALCS